MLARSYSGLWITKAKPMSLETFLELAISLGTSISSKSMHTVNGIILILMLLMIPIFSVDGFNRPLTKDD
jgi:hypothetical protein